MAAVHQREAETQSTNNLHHSRRFLILGGAMALVIVFGSIFTYIVANLLHGFNQAVTPITALYFTISTVTTVGFGDIYPVTALAKLYVIILIVVGLSTFIGSITVVMGDLVNERVAKLTGRLGPLDRSQLRGSIVLIGSNDVNMSLAKQFKRTKTKYLMVTSDKQIVDEWRDLGYRAYMADFMLSSEMKRFELSSAKAIIIGLKNSSKTVYALLVARKLANRVPITIIAEDPELEVHLEGLGLHSNERVVSPSETVAKQIANRF